MAHNEHIHNPNGAGYEVEDASVREIIISAIGLAVGTILICAAVFGLFRVLRSADVNSRQPLTDVTVQQTFPPGPRLQEKPWEEMQQLRQKEDQALTSYGWVNKNAGTVRIPIDRAMDIMAQKGFPVRSSGQTAATPTSPVSPGSSTPAARGAQGDATGVAR